MNSTICTGTGLWETTKIRFNRIFQLSLAGCVNTTDHPNPVRPTGLVIYLYTMTLLMRI